MIVPFIVLDVNCTKCEVPAFCLYWLAIIASRMVNGQWAIWAWGAWVEKLLMTKVNKIKNATLRYYW